MPHPTEPSSEARGRSGPPSIPFPAVPTPRVSEIRPDIVLIQSIRSGRAADFEVLYRRYRDWVYRTAYRWTRDSELALAVLQDSFAHLVGRLSSLEPHVRVTTILYPAVRALCAATRRSRDEVRTDALAAPNVEGERRAALNAAVRALGDERSEVLLMRVADGFGVTQVAAALGIPESSVKARLHEAIAALREDPGTSRYFHSSG